MRRFVVLVLVLLCAAASCNKGKAGKEKEFKFARRFESGPVSFRVSLSDSSVTIAQRVKMLLETHSQKGWRAELPKFGDKLSEFGIVDYHNYQPELGDGGAVVTKRLYELEPFLSGEYKIPPMVKTGGCVIGLDHRIPNGTPLENYRFSVAQAWEIMEREAGKNRPG